MATLLLQWPSTRRLIMPDPVMRRIDLEYCRIDNNRTHWHAKREVGQPQLQLENHRDGTSHILFGDNIQAQ
jgi:hypothetical protein